MPLRPYLSIIYNTSNLDISGFIRSFVLDISITQRLTDAATSVALKIRDDEMKFQNDPMFNGIGDSLDVELFYENHTPDRRLSPGRFYLDRVELSSPPDVINLQAINRPLNLALSRQFTETFRDPGPLSTFRRLVGPVRRAQRVNSTYTSYSTALENPHNAIHGWVGGVMGIVSYAAYDPIFWAHHCNIDRLFAEWQAAHPNITPNDMIWTAQLTPFGVTTADIWDIRRLGYDYLTAEAQPIVPADEKFGDSPIVGFALGAIEPEFEKAELEFQNLMHPRSSFEVRVFFNQPDANASTPMEGNDNYAGSLFLFGHGECQGEEGHCAPDRGPIDEFDIRRPSHVQPFSAYVDVTEAIRSLGGSLEVTVKLVAVDTKGNPITNPGTDFDAIALITT
ncbi:MAG: tyrosinase family protein [Symploca sp. SIO1A3]|nr:tyrosinase family protein [Symploca sp. SIO1A3]